MVIMSIFNKLQNLITPNIASKPASYPANSEFYFITFPKKTTDKEQNAENTEFLVVLDNTIKQYDKESVRCNKKIIEAQAKYPVLSSKIDSQEAVKIVYDFGVNSFSEVKKTIDTKYKTIKESIKPTVNKVYDFGVNSFSEVKKTIDTKYKTIKESIKPTVNKVYDFGVNSFSEVKKTIDTKYKTIKESIKPTVNKVYDFGVNSFSEVKKTIDTKYKTIKESIKPTVNKVYDFGVNSFSEVKKTIDTKYKTIKESIKPTVDKVYDFGVNSFSEVKKTVDTKYKTIKESIKPTVDKVYDFWFKFKFNLSFQKVSNNDQVEEILNTPENELDEIFEKMTYEKLAELINNIANEQAQKLVNYIMPCHFEKLMQFIPLDTLNMYIDQTLSLDELVEQKLKKLSNDDITDEQLENIIILVGEEKLVEKLDIIPNENLVRIMSNISNNKLATIIYHASDESLVRIIDIINSDNHHLSESLVGEIITLIHDKTCVKQEVEPYNVNYNMKLSGALSDSNNNYGFSFNLEDEIIEL
ncbi:hypothetical protein A1E_02215 [Rickettsia canadensis str. McKiel]|uniref:Uncharacterized protein n=1 Tax=Rickettsia canadensis (strain McKiel) TaxID=293613 RepID=A8EYF5_RICCK|nr:hypothetical protein [Rickettsia canadensis]ABV73388.1 hypothetical protein A1E_02215 [Rickettsia canadensis str. McKiel]